MKSIQLAKALTAGRVMVRTGKQVAGQVILKFRHPGTKDRIISPYPLQDQLKESSFTNLSATYSLEQLKSSNIEDLIVNLDLELKAV